MAYQTTLRVLQSLALLFQGRKYNTLRSRADTCEFELDQLLLGVLLFAMFFFLFPNIFGFYIFFAVVWAHVVLVQLLMSLLLLAVNHCPFYAIFLQLTSPGSVVGGVQFHVLTRGTTVSPDTDTAGVVRRSPPDPPPHARAQQHGIARWGYAPHRTAWWRCPAHSTQLLCGRRGVGRA